MGARDPAWACERACVYACVRACVYVCAHELGLQSRKQRVCARMRAGACENACVLACACEDAYGAPVCPGVCVCVCVCVCKQEPEGGTLIENSNYTEATE